MLSWHYLRGGSMIGCDGSGACNEVLSSQWSAIAGKIPVSGLAMGVYLTMLIAIFYIDTDTEPSLQRMAWSVLLLLVSAVAGTAIWFIIVQKWIIGEFCPYCMTEHTIGILMAIIIIWRAGTAPGNGSSLSRIVLTGGGLSIAVILAVSQFIFKPEARYRSGESQEIMPIMNYKTSPVIGSPDATYVINLLFDYQCPHCQKLHIMLRNAVSRYQGKLAFTLCPAPLNTECNPYILHDVDAFKNSCELVKIGMTVWVANREAYAAFDDWMYTPEDGNTWHPRSMEATKAKAIELVGQQAFDAASSSAWIAQYMSTCIELYGQTAKHGNGGVPKLVYGSHWVIPSPNNVDDLLTILQRNLGIPQP